MRNGGASKRVFATIKSKLMPAKLKKQYCYLHYNVFRQNAVKVRSFKSFSLRLSLRRFSDNIKRGIEAMKI